jgi:hypothetical protein
MNRDQMIAHLTLMGWEPVHSRYWFGVYRHGTGLVHYHYQPDSVARPGVKLAAAFDLADHSALGRDWGPVPDKELINIMAFISKENL